MAQERRLPEDFDRFERETVQRATVGISLPDGSNVEIPLTRVFGRCPEPRVVIVAGVHGDELVGPHALVELAQELSPSELRGTVVLVPSANPLAFAAGLRKAPDDGLDLNRIFPGNGGTATERVADTLVRRVIDGADLVIDLHSAGREGNLVPLSGFREAHNACAQRSALAAAAFGLQHYWMMRWSPGTLSTMANQRGIPAVGCEVGGRGMASRGNRLVQRYSPLPEASRHARSAAGGLAAPKGVDARAPCRAMRGLAGDSCNAGPRGQKRGETGPRAQSLWSRVWRNHRAAQRHNHVHAGNAIVGAGENVFWLGGEEDNPCYSSA